MTLDSKREYHNQGSKNLIFRHSIAMLVPVTFRIFFISFTGATFNLLNNFNSAFILLSDISVLN
jgi:hypothetical protein